MENINEMNGTKYGSRSDDFSADVLLRPVVASPEVFRASTPACAPGVVFIT